MKRCLLRFPEIFTLQEAKGLRARPRFWLLVVFVAVFSRIAIGFAQAQSDAEKLQRRNGVRHLII
jgi:hypothetical protein